MEQSSPPVGTAGREPRGYSPHGHVVHLHALPSGALVALHRKRGGDAVIVGDPGEPFRSIPTTRVSVARDGGTLHAETAEGTLFVSRALSGADKGPATWQGKPLTPVDAADYAIDLSVPSIASTMSALRP